MNKEELERNVNISVVSKALLSRDLLREAIADLEIYDLDAVVERVNLLVHERKEQEKAAGIEAIKAQMKALGVDLSDLQGMSKAAHKPRKSSGEPRRSTTTIQFSFEGNVYTIKSAGRTHPQISELFDKIDFPGSKREFIEFVQQGAMVDKGVELVPKN